MFVEETFQGAGMGEWQVAFEQHAVEAGQRGADLLGVFGYKRLHGVLLCTLSLARQLCRVGTPLAFSLWLRLCRDRTRCRWRWPWMCRGSARLRYLCRSS